MFIALTLSSYIKHSTVQYYAIFGITTNKISIYTLKNNKNIAVKSTASTLCCQTAKKRQ